jgi:hypothetical protein
MNGQGVSDVFLVIGDDGQIPLTGTKTGSEPGLKPERRVAICCMVLLQDYYKSLEGGFPRHRGRGILGGLHTFIISSAWARTHQKELFSDFSRALENYSERGTETPRKMGERRGRRRQPPRSHL